MDFKGMNHDYILYDDSGAMFKTPALDLGSPSNDGLNRLVTTTGTTYTGAAYTVGSTTLYIHTISFDVPIYICDFIYDKIDKFIGSEEWFKLDDKENLILVNLDLSNCYLDKNLNVSIKDNLITKQSLCERIAKELESYKRFDSIKFQMLTIDFDIENLTNCLTIEVKI